MNGTALAQQKMEPLGEEPLMVIEVLPEVYPENWVFAQDLNIAGLTNGKVVLVDVTSETDHYKGMMGIGMSDYVSQENMPDGGMDDGGMDDGGFDFDIGF